MSPAVLVPRRPALPSPSGTRAHRAGCDPDLVGSGVAIALLAGLLIGSTYALYRPAADDLWPFALAAGAGGLALAALGWSGGSRRGP